MSNTVEDLENFTEKNSHANYEYNELESFLNGIIDASKSMKEVYKNLSIKAESEEKPIDSVYYIVSLNGGLSLFDIMNITDPSLDINRAVYFPGSSKILNSGQVLRNCFENFIWERHENNDSITPLFSLDEVVGGHSVERLVNSYNSAIQRVARAYLNTQKQEIRKGAVNDISYDLREQFPLRIFGIRDMRELNRKMNERYRRLSNSDNSNRIINEFKVLKIITMDNPEYEVVRFERPNSSGWSGGGYYPKVKELVETRAYMDLLHDVARFVGADPELVSPSRARIKTHSEKYSKKPKYE